MVTWHVRVLQAPKLFKVCSKLCVSDTLWDACHKDARGAAARTRQGLSLQQILQCVRRRMRGAVQMQVQGQSKRMGKGALWVQGATGPDSFQPHINNTHTHTHGTHGVGEEGEREGEWGIAHVCVHACGSGGQHAHLGQCHLGFAAAAVNCVLDCQCACSATGLNECNKAESTRLATHAVLHNLHGLHNSVCSKVCAQSILTRLPRKAKHCQLAWCIWCTSKNLLNNRGRGARRQPAVHYHVCCRVAQHGAACLIRARSTATAVAGAALRRRAPINGGCNTTCKRPTSTQYLCGCQPDTLGCRYGVDLCAAAAQ